MGILTRRGPPSKLNRTPTLPIGHVLVCVRLMSATVQGDKTSFDNGLRCSLGLGWVALCVPARKPGHHCDWACRSQINSAGSPPKLHWFQDTKNPRLLSVDSRVRYRLCIQEGPMTPKGNFFLLFMGISEKLRINPVYIKFNLTSTFISLIHPKI